MIGAMLLLPPAAHATETTFVTFDGAWWTGLTNPEKLIAVQGMLVGYHGGYSDGAFAVVEKQASMRFKTSNPRVVEGKIYREVLSESHAGQDRNFAQIIRQLNLYFVNHPEHASNLVSEEMFCALNSGQDCAHLQK